MCLAFNNPLLLIMTNEIKSHQELQVQLGEGLRALRISRRMTQGELAAKAGVSPGAVASLERAEGSSVETMIRVLRAMDASAFIEGLAARPSVSPLALARSPNPPRRVRRSKPTLPA